MSKPRLNGPAQKKLKSLVSALESGQNDLAVIRAKVLFGMIGEDPTFEYLPNADARGKLRRLLNNQAAQAATS